MTIYDYLGIEYSSEKYDYDYNLIIDYEKFSYKECHAILNFLYKGSSLCEPDIIRLADIIIDRILIIQYDIVKPEYKDLVELVQQLFKVLNKIGNKTQKMIIYRNFNRFIKSKEKSNPSSPVSPPPPQTPQTQQTPQTPQTQPKIMKKAKNNIQLQP